MQHRLIQFGSMARIKVGLWGGGAIFVALCQLFFLKTLHFHRWEEGRVKLDNASSMALTKVGGLPVAVEIFFIAMGLFP